MDVIATAAAIAEYLGDDISYLDILDALASCRVTLAPDPEHEVAAVYLQQCEIEGAFAG